MGFLILINTSKMSTTESSSEDTVFSCSADGYTQMVQEIIGLVLLLYTLFQSTLAGIIDLMGLKYTARAMNLAYSFLTGSGAWIGYVIAAAYYFGLEFGYGEYLCTASSYG